MDVLNNEPIPPHIAAGANLSFFPLGTLFRRSGAFFLRRSFAGMPFYKLVFRTYLRNWFEKDTLSNSSWRADAAGPVSSCHPRWVSFDAADGICEGEFKDLQFIPINISYERVLETGSYRHELTGAKRPPRA